MFWAGQLDCQRIFGLVVQVGAGLDKVANSRSSVWALVQTGTRETRWRLPKVPVSWCRKPRVSGHTGREG